MEGKLPSLELRIARNEIALALVRLTNASNSLAQAANESGLSDNFRLSDELDKIMAKINRLSERTGHIIADGDLTD